MQADSQTRKRNGISKLENRFAQDKGRDEDENENETHEWMGRTAEKNNKLMTVQWMIYPQRKCLNAWEERERGKKGQN